VSDLAFSNPPVRRAGRLPAYYFRQQVSVTAYKDQIQGRMKEVQRQDHRKAAGKLVWATRSLEAKGKAQKYSREGAGEVCDVKQKLKTTKKKSTKKKAATKKAAKKK